MDASDRDVRQLRDDARELKHRVRRGDESAMARVVSSHPKYAGRPPERLRPELLTLRDAQATIAVERGFPTWSELVEALTLESTGHELLRWTDGASSLLFRRATESARSLGHSWCGPEHLLLAILAEDATVASTVLVDAGLSYDAVHARIEHRGHGPARDGVRTNPAWHACLGMASGLALAAGSSKIEDEHALLALLYSDVRDDLFDGFDVLRVELVEALAARGVPVPPLVPSEPAPFHGPMGSRVYYPTSEHEEVLRGVRERIPTGVHWGWNTNEQGLCWVDAEDDVDLAAIVRALVGDQIEIDVVPWDEALRRDDFARSSSD